MAKTSECFDLELIHPQDELADYVQAVWSASLDARAADNIQRWLHCDGSDGVWFNLSHSTQLGESLLTPGAYLLPVSRQSQRLSLEPGAQLAGIRFQPGVSYSLFQQRNPQPRQINEDFAPLKRLYADLRTAQNAGNSTRIRLLLNWLHHEIDFRDSLPSPLHNHISFLKRYDAANFTEAKSHRSQRQLERDFQQRLGMTPKQFQRIMRVNRTLKAIKNAPDTGLAELACLQGFADQAHMTREFNQIAQITPGQYRKHTRQQHPSHKHPPE